MHDCLMMSDQQDLSKIAVKLASLNWQSGPVEGDGNCLFRAVADQIANHPCLDHPIAHKMLKFTVINYLKSHKDEMLVSLMIYVLSTLIFVHFEPENFKKCVLFPILICLLQPKINGYLADYSLSYINFVTYMSLDSVWGDLVCNYILVKCLPVPYKCHDLERILQGTNFF